MLIREDLPVEKKLEILSDAAKYDVACTSSGVDRSGREGSLGNTAACGICHSFAADGRCISLLKILYTNECIHDCKYCLNRRSNDTLRTSFTPQEVCDLTIQFYRRNYIEGLFLSSGIRKSPDDTMEQIYITLKMLRESYHFNGYIHVKGIPGASPEWVEAVGYLADRMSLNLELATADGLKQLAPGKTREKILLPMRQIQKGIAQNRQAYLEDRQKALPGSNFYTGGLLPPAQTSDVQVLSRQTGTVHASSGQTDDVHVPSPVGKTAYESTTYPVLRAEKSRKDALFVPAGQSTQMIVGATPESDYQLLTVAESLYRQYDLKRVFYSAYIALNDDSMLPEKGTKPPLLREHRLYQADWLLRFYGFSAGELLSADKPNFNVWLDPKCEWAIRHLEFFPVEINRAPYDMLLRVPGIGVKSARRILRARRYTKLDFTNLKRIGVVLKRAHYFITCSGKMMYPTRMDENYITRHILELDHKKNWEIGYDMTFQQLSLFDDQSPLALQGEAR